MQIKTKNILIVEDDKGLNKGIAMALKNNACRLFNAFDIATAREKFKEEEIHLLILDINLPDGNGLDLLQDIRNNSNMPIIILTANDMELDIVTGLELGADDYICKPFSLMVLRARVNTQLRKLNNVHQSEIIIDDFIFNFEKMEFKKGLTSIELSKTEQKLLRILVENKGTIIPRGELVDKIWTDAAEYVDENALSVTIKRLRNKLEENPATAQYIKTIYGIGYTWNVK